MHTAYDLVWYAAERTPDHLAIVDDRADRRLTYRELIGEVERIAAGLAARGIGAGARFGTVLPNLFEHCLAILALARLNAVPALINARLSPAEIGDLVAQGDLAGAMVLANPEVAAAVARALPDGAPLLVAGDDLEGEGEGAGAEPFAAVSGDAATLAPYAAPGPDDLAFIFYTSGTTGLPKGVEIAHSTTLGRIVWISPLAGFRCGGHSRVLGLAPLSHAIGFYGNFLAALAYNATYYVVSQFDPAKAIEAIGEHRITMLFTVPTFYAAMARAPNYDPANLASLELVLYGGASIPPDLLEQLHREWPAAIRHIYGTTETMCSLYNPSPVGQATRLRPGFYSRVRVIRFGGGPDDSVGPDEDGELIVDANADTIFSGYLNRPDATAEKLRAGWYHTGDVFRQRADGDLEFIGRVDDVIRSGGENIHPEDIEPVLAAHPGVAEVSVVGVADDYWGEIAVAMVAAGTPAPSANALDAHCRASPLSPYKRPKGYVFVEALPRNAANKVLRRVLRETAAAARAGKDGLTFHDTGAR